MDQAERTAAAPRRVLVCAAETPKAFALVAAIRRHWGSRVHVITGDSNPAERVTASLFADRHFQMPPLDDPAFAEAIATIITREAVTDYIPLHDTEFATAEALRPGHPSVAIWSSGLQQRLAIDKRAAHQWLEALGLPVPVRYDLGSLPASGDVFVKPRRGYGGRGAARQPAEAVRRLPADAIEALMLQEVLAGPEVSVDSFYDAESGAHRAVLRERIEVKSGVCTIGRLRDDPLMSDYAQRIGAALGQRGTICFQAMRAAGGWAITDLNLRPGAGTSMGVAVGVDLLGAMLACRWGEPFAAMIGRPLPPGGIYVTRQYADYAMS